jgi:hypothetical protein
MATKTVTGDYRINSPWGPLSIDATFVVIVPPGTVDADNAITWWTISHSDPHGIGGDLVGEFSDGILTPPFSPGLFAGEVGNAAVAQYEAEAP